MFYSFSKISFELLWFIIILIFWCRYNLPPPDYKITICLSQGILQTLPQCSLLSSQFCWQYYLWEFILLYRWLSKFMNSFIYEKNCSTNNLVIIVFKKKDILWFEARHTKWHKESLFYKLWWEIGWENSTYKRKIKSDLFLKICIKIKKACIKKLWYHAWNYKQHWGKCR